MKKTAILFAFFLFAGVLFFRFIRRRRPIDGNGVVFFADDFQVIPETCRSTAVIMDGGAKDEPAKPAAQTAVKKAEEASPSPALPAQPEPRGGAPAQHASDNLGRSRYGSAAALFRSSHGAGAEGK